MSIIDDADVDRRGGSPLEIETWAAGGLLTLAVTGDLDMTTYETFCQALLDEADRETPEPLRLDLSEVDYIDARTWLLIVQAYRQLVTQHRPFSVILRPGRQPERVYRILGLDRVVPRS